MSAALLDKAGLQRYLRHKWGSDAITVTGLDQFARGVSRETWGIECRHDDGNTERLGKLILRRDLPSGSFMPNPLRFEYEVYRRLNKTAVKAAKALWYEDDQALTFDGIEFYLREQVEGSWHVPNVLSPAPEHIDYRIELSKDLLRNLATVHMVDWKAAGFDEIHEVPEGPHDCARSQIDRLMRDLDQCKIEPLPMFTEAREWLLDHAPVAPRICLQKGTNGIGEEVYRDGRIVAMSDWECSGLGDPASDFARNQDLIPELERNGKPVWGLRHALDYYRELTGMTITPEAIDYYRVLVTIDSVASLSNGAKPFLRGEDMGIRRAYFVTEIVPKFKKLMLDAVNGRSTAYACWFYNTLPVKTGGSVVATSR